MKIHELVDEGLGHSSYLVEIEGQVLVIDPPRFPTAIEGLAQSPNTRVAWTADTTSRADYVTGSPALAARAGATFLAPAASRLEVLHQPLADDEVVQLGGGYSLQALATPGHTPDHMAYLLRDNAEPAALFSGGSLMVGTVGRTDLLGTEQAEPLAHQMFHSLRDRILTLPDDLPVYPTHGAGSFCSAPGSIPAMPLPEGPVTMMCGHGERAMTAASVLAQRGHTDLRMLEGGPEDWATTTGQQLESAS